jgi:hypothetical protein
MDEGKITGSGVASRGSPRDLRVDFFRGVALWMIFTDHILGNFFARITYHRFGFSDGAEIFIFLSGVSCAIAYGRILRRRGWADAQRRSLRRALQIYGAYLAAVLGAFGTAWLLRDAVPPGALAALNLEPVLGARVAAFIDAARLYYMPFILDVLPLYMLLVPLAPLFVGALDAGALRWAAVLSFCIWLFTQIHPAANLPAALPPGSWLTNPFSWQFLFFIGVFVGWRHYLCARPFVPSRWGIAAAIAVVVLALAFRVPVALAQQLLPAPALPLLLGVLDASIEPAAKAQLSLLRIVHFLAVVYLVAAFFRSDAVLRASAWARPLIVCGQNSLVVFAVSMVLNVAASLYMLGAQPGIAAQLALTLCGWALLWAVAEVAARPARTAQPSRPLHWPPSPPSPISPPRP